jgi:ribosomal-protein-serine acetyltransferase
MDRLSRLPGHVVTPRLQLRLWRVEDAPALSAAIERSLDHLRPWMWWAADEPRSPEDRIELIRSFRRDWEAGGDAALGVFRGDEAIGSSGFHRRRGPHVLEIGYWIHVDHVRQGYATEAVAALTDTAFTVPGVEWVEIHHDRANVRSRAVPARLGFRFVGESPDVVRAPAEEGVDCTWRVTRDQWSRAGASPVAARLAPRRPGRSLRRA